MALIDFQIAGRNLAQHRKRTLLLGGATALVTMMMVQLMALTDGIQETILHAGSTLMTGHVNVGGFYKVTAGSAAPLVLDADKVLAAVRPDVPELDLAIGRGRGYATAVAPTGSMDLVLGGLDFEKDRRFSDVVAVAEGSLAELSKPNTILVFQTEAKRLGVKVGDTLTLSAPTFKGMANTADVRVAAIAKDMGAMSFFNAYISFPTLATLYQLRPGSTGALHLYLKDPYDAPAVAERLRKSLAAKGYRVMEADGMPYYVKLYTKVGKEDWTGQKLDITTWADEMSFMNQALLMIKGLNFMMLVVLILIVGAGVMSTMWIAIRERTREIGTLRAIGMHRRRVMGMFLVEALLLGLLGTSVGAAVGAGTSLAINALGIPTPEAIQAILMADKVVFAPHLSSALASIAGITLWTTLVALIPAFFAARLEPVTAMHHIG
ncbi:MAG TPA: FtsX-like permease family protein [Myxococcales bacterium]